MTSEDDDAPGGPDREYDGEPYEVGYGRPPKATRFRPGRSGNPKGRPRGSRNARPKEAWAAQLPSIVRKEAYRMIEVRDGGKMSKMSIVQAAMRSLAVQAAQGKQGAQRMLMQWLAAAECHLSMEREKTFKVALEYKLGAEAEIREARRLNRNPPDILPHPDDLIIDPYAGTVTLKGPLTAEERTELAHFAYLRSGYAEDLAWEESHPEDAINSENIARLRKLIETFDLILNMERAYWAEVIGSGAGGDGRHWSSPVG